MDIKKAKGVKIMLEDKAVECKRRFNYLLADLMEEAANTIGEAIAKETPMESIPALKGPEVICPACNVKAVNDGRYCKWCGQRLK